MNGLNKKQKWRKQFYALGVIYVMLLLVAIGVFIWLPTFSYNMQVSEIEQTKQAVNQAVSLTNKAEQQVALQQIVERNNVDVIIHNEDELVFSTLPIIEFKDLEDIIRKEQTHYQAAYLLTENNIEYQIWMTIYDSQKYDVTFYLGLIISSIIISSLILSIMVILIFRQLLFPIKRLQRNIMKLKAYRFEEMPVNQQETEYDVLSKALDEFQDDLQEKMEHVGAQYTHLEQELQIQKEESIYRNQLVSSLIHNLKSPLNVRMAYEDKLLLDHPQLSTNINIEEIQRIDQQLIQDINEVLTLVQHDEAFAIREESQFDIVPLIHETIQLFKPIFQQRKIIVDVVMPRSLTVTMSVIECKQILHNIISNVCQYADEAGEFIFEIYGQEQNLYLTAYNDRKDVTSIDFTSVFDLFYSDTKINTTYGSGIGMFVIQNMVKQYAGSCTFQPRDTGVELEIILPVIR